VVGPHLLVFAFQILHDVAYQRKMQTGKVSEYTVQNSKITEKHEFTTESHSHEVVLTVRANIQTGK